MSKFQQQCVYACGPYQGYWGRAEYDGDADLFHGEVQGLRDVVTFQARTPRQLQNAFRQSVDDYLKFCAERNESPEKPFSGKFVTRIEPGVHRQLTALAEMAGKSLNQFVADHLSTLASAEPIVAKRSEPRERNFAREPRSKRRASPKPPRRSA